MKRPAQITAPPAESMDERPDIEAIEPPSDVASEAKLKESRERPSPIIKQVRDEEERSLRDWLETLGPDGAFRVQLRREQPEAARDPATGKEVSTKGYCATYERPIDEAFIQKTWGGGTYSLKVMTKDARGSFVFKQGFHRTLSIAGEPNLENLPGRPPPATGASQPTDSGNKAVVEILRDQLTKAERKAEDRPHGIDPSIQLLLEQMREQMREQREASAREVAALRTELSAARTAKPAEDPIKDRLLGSLIDGQSGHVEALRLRHEAELRQIKEGAIQDERRLHDRFERDMSAVRSGHEREIAAMRSSHEMALSSARSSFELQATLLAGDVKRLERDNAELRAEVKDLRAKKDKPIPEQLKELRELKDLVNDGETGDKSNWDRLGELITNPALIDGVQGILARRGEAAAAATASARVTQPPPKLGIVSAPDGQKYRQVANPEGGVSLIPVKKKPKVVATEDGGALELPEVDPAQVANLIGFLERAYAGRQDPEVVARSGRSVVPDQVLKWIREHDTEQVSGVDLFMSKVAQLPGGSPLGTQGGRNWIRQVGKALIE